MTPTDYVDGLLRVFNHSSQQYPPAAFHARKWADMHIRVVNAPRWPLLRSWEMESGPGCHTLVPFRRHLGTGHDVKEGLGVGMTLVSNDGCERVAHRDGILCDGMEVKMRRTWSGTVLILGVSPNH